MSIYKEINDGIDLVDTFAIELGIDVGVGQQICCPFHNDSTPSMKIYNTNSAFCFGECGKSFTPYDVIKHAHSDLSFKQLIEYIKDKYQIDLDTKRNTNLDNENPLDNYFAENYEKIKMYIYKNRDNKALKTILKRLEIALYHLVENNSTKYFDKLLLEIGGISEKSNLEL